MWSEIVSASRECQKLDYVWRYSTIPISVPENVSTHSYWVTVYSAMIHQALNPSREDLLTACVLTAAVHDTPEGKVGDFVRTFKYRTPELKSAIDAAEQTIIEEFPAAFKVVFDLAGRLSADCGSPQYVKAIVKAADFLSLFNFMVREITRGNGEIVPYYRRMVSDLKMMSETTKKADVVDGVAFYPTEFYGYLADSAQKTLNIYDRKDESLRNFSV